MKQHQKVWAENNRDRLKSYRHDWYMRNRERITNMRKERYAQNTDGCRDRMREHNRERHKDPVRRKAKAYSAWKNDLLRYYGLTVDQYNALLFIQDGKCAICEVRPEDLKKKRRLAVDHCHKTGKVRGLLCHVCNTMLGKYDDDVRVFNRASDYLEKYERINSTEDTGHPGQVASPHFTLQHTQNLPC